MTITQNGVLQKDDNDNPVMGGTSSSDDSTIINAAFDPITRRLLTDAAGGGSGTVTDVSVVTANGFAGSVANSTTTPAITLTTTINSPVLAGNGTALIAATTTGSGSTVVLQNTPTLTTPVIGAATGTSLSVTGILRSQTSLVLEETGVGTDIITIQAPASIAASYTLTLPIDDGNSGEVLSTDGAGVLSWVSAGGVPTAITVANEATDTSCFLCFFTAATGDLGPKTNVNMLFNSNTGVVTLASSILTTTDINGGTIDGTVIGASSAAAITGTVITANTSVLPDADGGAAIGSATLGFTILGLSSGSTINFANGNVLLTHSSAILTVTTGDLRMGTAGTNAASVVTVGGTQTLTNKTLTSPTLTTPSAFTTGGTITLAENTSIALDPAGSADGKYTGITITGTAGTTLAFGDLIYLAVADSRWELTDADAAATAGGILVGICVLAAAADGSATNILLQGTIRADAKFPALTVGAAVYVSTTTGEIQVAQPSGTDDVIRVVGFALTADEIYFNPSPDYITHT